MSASACSSTFPFDFPLFAPRCFTNIPRSARGPRPMQSLPLTDETPGRRPLTIVGGDAGGEAASPDPGSRPRRLPTWLKRKLPHGNGNSFTHGLLRELRLETV